MPFFSIMLPTKNRASLLAPAIQSVLKQSFKDYELIICDNDDDENKTKEVVESFNDERIHYIRTGHFSMQDNWNRALDGCVGKYVIAIEDKMVLYPWALRKIHEQINEKNAEVVLWNSDVVDDASEKIVLKQRMPGEFQNYSSDDILARVSVNIMKNWGFLPRGLNCAISKEVIDAVRELGSEPYYEAVSIDIVSALKVLRVTEEILIYSGSMTLITSDKTSNGRMALTRKGDMMKYFMGKSDQKLDLAHVPLKDSTIVTNIVVNDFRNMAEKYGGILKNYSVSEDGYLRMMAREFVRSTALAKKIVWSMDEIKKLTIKSSAPFSHTIIFLREVATIVLFTIFSRFFSVGKNQQDLRSFTMPGNQFEVIQAFLDGRSDFGIYAKEGTITGKMTLK